MVSFVNNPFLKDVGSIEGAKHLIRRRVNSELKALSHITDAVFVRNRLKAVGVNTVGSDESLLKFWKKQVDEQMTVTHQLLPVKVKPVVKRGLAKKIGRAVGFATRVLL